MTPAAKSLDEQDPGARFAVWLFGAIVAVAPLPLCFLVGKGAAGYVGVALLAPVLLGAMSLLRRRLGKLGARHAAYVLFAIFVLVDLPLLGLGVDSMAEGCTEPHCDPNFRPLAFPEVFELVPLQAAVVVAFFLSVRRPSDLGPRIELAIAAALLAGVVLHVLLGVQFAKAVPLGFYIIPSPIFTPYLTVPLLLHQLVTRLRARGHDALVRARERPETPEPTYREPSPREGDDEPEVLPSPVHFGLLGRGLAGMPALLGLHAVIMAAIFQRPTGGIETFIATCGYTFSKLPIPPTRDCHYLCTIAAQGDPRLVKPYRWGRRGGQPILVNRQLALANAFEDLLHERWPRFGALARRTYDRLAFPVHRWLSHRWVANVVYIAMKPAEVVFFLVLLFLDPGDPESRIDRMYR